jgi:hypothetical protein
MKNNKRQEKQTITSKLPLHEEIIKSTLFYQQNEFGMETASLQSSILLLHWQKYYKSNFASTQMSSYTLSIAGHYLCAKFFINFF